MEGCLVLGRTALYSMQMASQGGLSALGHWGLTRCDEGYGLTSGVGNQSIYTTKPGVAKEGECGPKEASQSS